MAWELNHRSTDPARYLGTDPPQEPAEHARSGGTVEGYRRAELLRLAVPNGQSVWPEQDGNAAAHPVADRIRGNASPRPDPDAEQQDWPTQSARDWQRIKDFWASMPLGETGLEVAVVLTGGLVAAAALARFAPLVLGALKSDLGRRLGVALAATAVGASFNEWFGAAWTASDDPNTREQRIEQARRAFKVMAKAIAVQQFQAKVAGTASQAGAETSHLPAPLTTGTELAPTGAAVANGAIDTLSYARRFGIQGVDGKWYPPPGGGSFPADDELSAHQRAPVIDLLENDRVVDIQVRTVKTGESLAIELHTKANFILGFGHGDILVGRVSYSERENGKMEVDLDSLFANPGYAGVRQRLAAELAALGTERQQHPIATPSTGIDRFRAVPDFASTLKSVARAQTQEQWQGELMNVMSQELKKVNVLPLGLELTDGTAEQFAFSAEHWAVRIDSSIRRSTPSPQWYLPRMEYAFFRAMQSWEVIRYMHHVRKLPVTEIERHFASHAVQKAIVDSSALTAEQQARAEALYNSITSPETSKALANVEQTNAECKRLAESLAALAAAINASNATPTREQLAQYEAALERWRDAAGASMGAAMKVAKLPHEQAAWDATHGDASPLKRPSSDHR